MSILDNLLGRVTGGLLGGQDERELEQQQYDQNQQGQYQQGGYDNVLPASQDPYGDPADQEGGFGNVLPASQDPYGDPADQQGFPKSIVHAPPSDRESHPRRECR